MSQTPLVTVFTLVFNSGPFTIKALERFKSQTYPNIEHIVIDDCSVDGSGKLVKQWLATHMPSSQFIQNNENAGINRNLNRILAMAKGDFLIGVCDDLFHKDIIRTLLDQFDNDVAVVFGDCRVVDQNDVVLIPSYFRWASTPEPLDQSRFQEALLWKNTIPAQPVLLRASAIRALGGWDEDLLFEDWDMWLRAFRVYKFVKVNQILADYVKRAGAMTSNKHYFSFDLTCAKAVTKQIGISDRCDRIVAARVFRLALAQIQKPEYAVQILDLYLSKKRNIKLQLLKLIAQSPVLARVLREAVHVLR